MEYNHKDNNGQSYMQYHTMIEPEGYIKIGIFILLSVITFGIYLFFWIYKTIGLLKKKTGINDGQVAQLLLCMFVPFYYIYWLYKYTKIFSNYSASVGYVSKGNITTTCMTLAICSCVASVLGNILIYFGVGVILLIVGCVFGIAGNAKFQSAINNFLLYELTIDGAQFYESNHIRNEFSSNDKYEPTNRYTNPTYNTATTATDQVIYGEPESKMSSHDFMAASTDANTVEQLRELKSLYDEGILTAEEFAYKKKQLLN